MTTETELMSLQKRVIYLEKKIKSWSRIFRQETLWKHNLEEWLMQHFDYNIRLQTELSFFKSSDEEEDNRECDTGYATKAFNKQASRKHMPPGSVARRGSGVQIINCQTNSPIFQPRESNDELIAKRRRLNSFDDGNSIEIGSTTVSTIQSHTSGRYSQFRNSNAIVSNSNDLPNANRFTIVEVDNSSNKTASNFGLPNPTLVPEIVKSNTIILNQRNPEYEYESEESYALASSSRRKSSKEGLLPSQEDSEISPSNRQYSSNVALDGVNPNEVLVVSDDSDSSSVVFINNYEADRSNRPPVNYTHQCTSCGRRISTQNTTFSHFLKIEETTCFVCQIEQINQHDGSSEAILVDSDTLNTPQIGIIELVANSGVELDAKVVKKALVKSDHWSECARLLIRNYFPREVLLRSNAKGGERKVPGGDGSRHVPLDENVIYIIKNFVKEFWISKGGMPLEVDKGFNRVVNKVCQRERDKVKRKQHMEEQIKTSFFQQLEVNVQQNT